jgi:hypothetical protein
VKRRLALDGVFRGNQRVPNWSIYLRSWLEERGVGSVVDMNDKQADCRIRGDVLTFQQIREPNPEYQKAQDELKSCGLIKALAKLLCDNARERVARTPRDLSGYKVSVDVAVIARNGERRNKLRDAKYVAPGNVADPERAQRHVLQNSIGNTVTEMFREGACD